MYRDKIAKKLLPMIKDLLADAAAEGVTVDFDSDFEMDLWVNRNGSIKVKLIDADGNVEETFTAKISLEVS